MRVDKSNNVTTFDCDDTLVMWPKDFRIWKPGRITFMYGGEEVYLEAHSYHVTFLKHCANRGDHVVVWSANGYAWAENIVATLGLEPFVSVVMSKPTRHVDDRESASSIVGSRVYIPHETYEGKKRD